MASPGSEAMWLGYVLIGLGSDHCPLKVLSTYAPVMCPALYPAVCPVVQSARTIGEGDQS